MEIEGTIYEILAKALNLVKTETGVYADPHRNKFILTKYGFQDVTVYGLAYIDQLKFKHDNQITSLKKEIFKLKFELDDLAHKAYGISKKKKKNGFPNSENVAIRNYDSMKMRLMRLKKQNRAWDQAAYELLDRDNEKIKAFRQMVNAKLKEIETLEG